MIERTAIGETNQKANTLVQARADILATFDGETRTAYDRWIAWTKNVGIGRQALRTGDRLPGFLLPDAYGRLVAAGDILGSSRLVIIFVRGDWCPFCCAQLRLYERRMKEMRRLRARVVAITPDTYGHPRSLMRKIGLQDVEVLSDVDYGFGLACGLIGIVPPVGRAELKRRSVDLPQRHGTSAWMLPVPATYVVDEHGVIGLHHVDADFTRRAEPETIVARLVRSR